MEWGQGACKCDFLGMSEGKLNPSEIYRSDFTLTKNNTYPNYTRSLWRPWKQHAETLKASPRALVGGQDVSPRLLQLFPTSKAALWTSIAGLICRARQQVSGWRVSSPTERTQNLLGSWINEYLALDWTSSYRKKVFEELFVPTVFLLKEATYGKEVQAFKLRWSLALVLISSE